MSLEFILYVIFFLLSVYILLSSRIEKFFKQGKILEIRLAVIIISMCISYLATNFIISFLEVSKVI